MEIKTRDEVNDFLQSLKNILQSNSNSLYIVKKNTSKSDKTAAFMNEHNIKSADVIKELLLLDVTNYAYTDDDHSPYFQGEVWVFGSYITSIPHCREELYIKLKLKGRVVCLSFHPAEISLEYPYL